MKTTSTKPKETCLKCGEEFEDINFNPKLPLAKRIYCNDCIDILTEEDKKELEIELKRVLKNE